MSRNIRIIKPAGREQVTDFSARISQLEASGFNVFYDDFPPNASWPYTSGSISDRVKQLSTCLSDPKGDVIFAVRGGYGCSDLLELIDWQQIKKSTPKTIVGFSDISALMSACYTKLGWRGIHGPMLGSSLWEWKEDVNLLLAILRREERKASFKVRGLNQIANQPTEVTGKLFGGCFSVLTNLIGTEYIPSNLAGHILFLEDIGENPGRLLRFWNQWNQAKLTRDIGGVILGHFKDLGPGLEDNSEVFLSEFAARCPFPVWHTTSFGHKTGNIPMPIGALIHIQHNIAQWDMTEERS